VQRVLPAIVTDLEIRADALLNSISGSPPAELSVRVDRVRRQAEMLRGEAHALRGLLGDPADASDHFDQHLDLNRILRQLELFDLPLLQRWSPADRLITEMCHALLGQVDWPFEFPLVACFSTEYYWAHPIRKIIAAPANEEQRLLAVGDLAHELGHLAFVEDPLRFVGPVLVEVARYVQRNGVSPPPGLNVEPRAFFAELSLAWRAWLQEFVCDAIATYLVGPAFAWQHLRLACMEDSSQFYEPVGFDADHPADDARLRLSLLMLEQLGHHEAACEIEECWGELLTTVGATETPEYEAAYPDELLRAVVLSVRSHCQRRGLRAYDPDAECDDVARLANDAWERLHAEPDGYAEWERQALSACRGVWAGSLRPGPSTA
jgi:hypothetical protein